MNNKYQFIQATNVDWHLIDQNGQELLYVTDPSEELYDPESGEALSYDKVLDLCANWLLEEARAWENGEDFNGIKNCSDKLPDPWCTSSHENPAAVAMAKALYESYIEA